MSGRRKISTKTRLLVLNRAGSQCEYCLSAAEFSSSPFSVEHILPVVDGGSNSLDNLALSCMGCNRAKYMAVTGKDPTTGKIVALYHPRSDSWNDHFEWSYDGLYIVGTTETGRATIVELDLNRQGTVNLREALLSLTAYRAMKARDMDQE